MPCSLASPSEKCSCGVGPGWCRVARRRAATWAQATAGGPQVEPRGGALVGAFARALPKIPARQPSRVRLHRPTHRVISSLSRNLGLAYRQLTRLAAEAQGSLEPRRPAACRWSPYNAANAAHLRKLAFLASLARLLSQRPIRKPLALRTGRGVWGEGHLASVQAVRAVHTSREGPRSQPQWIEVAAHARVSS